MALLNIFRRSDYTSDTTQFIDQLKAQKPTLEAEQRAGRALLWDKNLDRDRAGRIRRGPRAPAALRLRHQQPPQRQIRAPQPFADDRSRCFL
jgi:hypothetical protein